MSAPLLNVAYLESLTDGNAAVERELFRLFYETSERCLRGLEATTDAEAIHTLLHEWKGAAAGIGAEYLAQLCDTPGIAVEELSKGYANFQRLERVRQVLPR